MKEGSNPVIYFEIPVTDLDRAIQFYTAVFDFKFQKNIIDNYDMAFFPFNESNSGITGALVKGDVYVPSKTGIFIYFKTTDIDKTLKLAIDNGGKTLYPKTLISDSGYVAEFEDSEGNRIALHQKI